LSCNGFRFQCGKAWGFKSLHRTTLL
jgi:hypothetical protein